jgi:tetratricopeptide (TPR) repeat protein
MFVVFLILLSGYTAFIAFKHLMAKNRWHNLRNNYTLSRDETKANYADLYPTLKHDGKFLTEYGGYLIEDSADCIKAVEVLERAKQYFISRKTIEATGYAYWQLKNYSKAIENFEWLSNFIPSLFAPKYELLKLYNEKGDNENAKRMANIILTMPVKIPSDRVEQIKEDTKKILQNL